MPATSLLWNLKHYAFVEWVKWIGRAVSYRAWLLTPLGRCEAKFDVLNSIDTEGYLSEVELGLPTDSIHYAPIKPRQFEKIVGYLRVDRSRFTFIDVGCGKGRPLLLAKKMGFGRVVGVELSPTLAEIAKQNIRDADVHVMDAAHFDFPAEDSVVFMFNPFWEPTFGKVIRNLIASFQADPRRLYLVYVNPFCKASLEKFPEIKELKAKKNLYSIYQLSCAIACFRHRPFLRSSL